MKNNLPVPPPVGSPLFLSFRIGDRRLAIPFLRVGEVRTLQTSIPVLRAPDYGTGQVSLQGQPVPLVDLRVRLGAPPRFDHDTRLIVTFVSHMGEDDTRACLVVDSIEDVVELTDQPAPAVPGVLDRTGFTRAGTDQSGAPLLLVDINRLMEEDIVTA